MRHLLILCTALTLLPAAQAQVNLRPSAEPSHWARMSPACRQQAQSLQSLQQSVDVRNLQVARQQQRVIAEEQQRYNVVCREEEMRARLVASQALRAEYERELVHKQRQEQQTAQCHEMRRLRDAKLARWDQLTPGERADHERFAANFAQRCQGIVRVD